MEKFDQKLNKIEKQEKPEFLYHASSNKNISEFEPRKEKVRDPEEGSVVFATPDLALASAFLMKELDDSWSHKGNIDGVSYVAINDRDLFNKLDKGGAIYKLPGNSFSCDIKKGMGELEWTTKECVSPVDKVEYSSVLEAMLNNGLQVYFVDKDAFNKINSLKMPDDVVELINILRSLKSENQVRNINYKDFI
jgi:hypothetical protein